MTESVENLLGERFWTVSKEPCWAFCRQVLELLHGRAPSELADMARIETARIGSVVLFRQKEGFHAGVVWPDNLHFIHARNPLNQPELPPVARKDRLSDPLYEPLIDGFYIYH